VLSLQAFHARNFIATRSGELRLNIRWHSCDTLPMLRFALTLLLTLALAPVAALAEGRDRVQDPAPERLFPSASVATGQKNALSRSASVPLLKRVFAPAVPWQRATIRRASPPQVRLPDGTLYPSDQFLKGQTNHPSVASPNH